MRAKLAIVMLVVLSLVGCQMAEAAPRGLLGGRGIGLGGLLGGGGAFNRGLGFNNFGAGLGFNNFNRFRNNRVIVIPQYINPGLNTFSYGAGLGCASYVPPVATFAAAPCDCGAQTLGYGATYGASGCNQALGYAGGYGAGLGVGACSAGFAGYGAVAAPIILRGHVFRGGHHH